MGKVVIIGAGGVGQVVAYKCAANPEVFESITLASRTVSKCEKIATQIKKKYNREIQTAQVNADNVPELTTLLQKLQPDLVINVALPYQDLHIMDACLNAGVDYLDTANYEPLDEARFCYKWQWDYQQRFKEAGLMALLGSGFDPGVTNVFTAYANKHHFDQIDELEIIDVNGGDHGQPFATNFNPEINIREITAPCRHWENEQFIESEAMSSHKKFVCPDNVGTYTIYRMYHEEMESLVKHIPSIKKASFWMSFSENYLTHLKVLQNVGMTRIDPVEYNGQQIVPLQFLKSVLPDPSSLGPLTHGRTCIGCICTGIKDGKEKKHYIYNICQHEDAYNEVESQAISYTTGVPAMIGAMMILTGKWKKAGVYNMEQFDPDPFMDALNKHGLPWQAKDL